MKESWIGFEVYLFFFRNNTENNAIEIAFNEIRPTFVADVFLMLKLKDVKRATLKFP